MKKENEQLKNELKIKNEVISSLQKKNEQIDEPKNKIIYNKHINFNKKSTDTNDNDNDNEIDMEKLRKISIDPDDI